MLRHLSGGRSGGGLASAAAAATAAFTADHQSLASAAAAVAVASGNLRLLRHLSADASSSSSGQSSSSVADDPRWKSPLFDALLSLAARARTSTSATSSTSPATTTSTSSPPQAPRLPPPLRSVVAERHGLFDFLLDGARAAQARILVHLIRSKVETSFDEKEFLEGAADARHAVFDALSDDGDLALLRGAVSPGLLRTLHGLKEMHAAAGLTVKMTAAAAEAPENGDSAELGVMGLLDQPLFEAMSEAVPGFEVTGAGGGAAAESSSSSSSSSSSEGEGDGEGGSSCDATAADASPSSPTVDVLVQKRSSGAASSTLDIDSCREAIDAAKTEGGVFSGRYQVLAVRFTGSVLVQTFAKTISSSSSPSSATKSEEEKEEGEERKEKASGVVGASSKATTASPRPSSSSSSSSPPPKSMTTLTLVRELLDKRPHSWRFVRGPLPEGLPVRQLGLPWTLLSIDLD